MLRVPNFSIYYGGTVPQRKRIFYFALCLLFLQIKNYITTHFDLRLSS